MFRIYPRILAVFLFGLVACMAARSSAAEHSFAIGEKDFLLDGSKFQIRCGEMHFARVPREYWRHRLQLCKAMGLNTVCAYLFWNYHEFEEGKFDWSDNADAVEFCRIAQQEGLWVVLRPGPYACAEWDMGGLPWWLLKKPDIKLRSRDPNFISASRRWLKEVGRVLAPLQVTNGGPILMVQVENEYGFYGSDVEYMGEMRQALLDGKFDVPLFACNPVSALTKGLRKDLFQVVNFGKDPATGFKALRAIQPTGPLMCGEFYPGWFDTWGFPHHLGNTEAYLKDLDYMLSNGCSFSIYMAEGGTSFGLWSGADRPFKPDTSSYDYDAPITEAGWLGDKFASTRALMEKHLLPGEKIPEPPPANPTQSIPSFELSPASLFANLPKAIADSEPRTMEAYDQGHGCMLYRTTIPAGPAGAVDVNEIRDFAWVFVDGKQVGVMDRRSRRFHVDLPARIKPARLDILVEAMGHVNFGQEVHDRKGLYGPVKITGEKETSVASATWSICRIDFNPEMLASLKWEGKGVEGPAFWHGSFEVSSLQDTFLDVSAWGKGVVWLNGHCLGRFWNIGPTQTMYVPGPWLRKGKNEVLIFDLLGPKSPTLAGLEKPILNRLRRDLDINRAFVHAGHLSLAGIVPTSTGTFEDGTSPKEIRFESPKAGRQFCIESVSTFDGQGTASIAELDLLDRDGKPLPRNSWTISFADSEELGEEDGSALNAIDGQTANAWISASSKGPHQLVIDLGANESIGGFRYVPRSGKTSLGHIKDYRVFVGAHLTAD